MKKLIEKTNGKKTTSTAIAYIIFQLIKLTYPEFVSGKEDLIEYGLVLLFSTGILHKAWKNRIVFLQWIKELFKSKK